MKPTTQINDLRSGLETTNRALRILAGPKTDYALRAASLTQFGGRRKGTGERPFREISGAYFRNEAGRAFALEAGLFAVIAGIAALPIANSIAALIHLARAFAF